MRRTTDKLDSQKFGQLDVDSIIVAIEVDHIFNLANVKRQDSLQTLTWLADVWSVTSSSIKGTKARRTLSARPLC